MYLSIAIWNYIKYKKCLGAIEIKLISVVLAGLCTHVIILNYIIILHLLIPKL